MLIDLKQQPPPWTPNDEVREMARLLVTEREGELNDFEFYSLYWLATVSDARFPKYVFGAVGMVKSPLPRQFRVMGMEARCCALLKLFDPVPASVVSDEDPRPWKFGAVCGLSKRYRPLLDRLEIEFLTSILVDYSRIGRMQAIVLRKILKRIAAGQDFRVYYLGRNSS
jgi:hypothetical protein